MIQWNAAERDVAAPARIDIAYITGVGDAPFERLQKSIG